MFSPTAIEGVIQENSQNVNAAILMPYQVDFSKRASKSSLKAKFVEKQIKKRQSGKLRGLLAFTFLTRPKRL